MPNSQPIPVQFTDDPPGIPPVSGEFIMSGSLTPVPRVSPGQDLRGAPPQPMPGFHRRKEVRRMLRGWRNGLSLWGQIWVARPRDPWEATQRFTLPQHTTYIK